jgi:hypothetical protein
MRRQLVRSGLLLAAAAWTLFIWVTRMWNIARDPAHSFGFKAVHGLLAAVSVAFAMIVGLIGWRMRREARAGREVYSR